SRSSQPPESGERLGPAPPTTYLPRQSGSAHGSVVNCLCPSQDAVAAEDISRFEGSRRVDQLPGPQPPARVQKPRLRQPVLGSAGPGRDWQLILRAQPLDSPGEQGRPPLMLGRDIRWW